MNPKVDLYLEDGCGRCKFYKTAQCKVHNWQPELKVLRQMVLDCGLVEDLKWGVPVYTHHEKNVVNVSAFKDYCVLSFFKGALLNDAEKLLRAHGESSQAVRTLNFTAVADILKIEKLIKTYIFEAIEIEKAGLKVDFKKNLEPVPIEFQQKMDENQALKTAFYALTPGRQRGYIIHFSQPKQAQTRVTRIEKKVQKILDGFGFAD